MKIAAIAFGIWILFNIIVVGGRIFLTRERPLYRSKETSKMKESAKENIVLLSLSTLAIMTVTAGALLVAANFPKCTSDLAPRIGGVILIEGCQ